MHQSPAVLVGVDGSRSATAAALWAVDEAVSRDIPVRLLQVVPRRDRPTTAHDIDRASDIVDTVTAAIEATGKQVKVETQLAAGDVTDVLREQARHAAMLCIGSSGREHAGMGHRRATVLAVVPPVDCPVAVIHSPTAASSASCVVAEVDDSPAGDLALRRGIDEALLRGLPLRVVTAWPARYPDIQDGSAGAVSRIVRTRLQRRLAAWREQHPGLDMRPVAVPGKILNYLARHRDEIALAVVPHDRGAGITELVSTTPPASEPDLSFNVMICEPAGPPERARHVLTSSSEQSG